jgi:hypothetical protein
MRCSVSKRIGLVGKRDGRRARKTKVAFMMFGVDSLLSMILCVIRTEE